MASAEEYYRFLVSGVPPRANAELLLKTRFKSILPSHVVVDVHTLGATDAVVTLRGPAGSNFLRMIACSDAHGSPLTLQYLGTENTLLTIQNIHPTALEALAQLAPAYNVGISTGKEAVQLHGLLDNIYNLRSELDAFLVRSYQTSITSSPQTSLQDNIQVAHPSPGPTSYPPPGLGQAASYQPQGQITSYQPQGQVTSYQPQGQVTSYQSQGQVTSYQHQGQAASYPTQDPTSYHPSQDQAGYYYPSQGQAHYHPSQGQAYYDPSQGQAGPYHPSQGQAPDHPSQGQVHSSHPPELSTSHSSANPTSSQSSVPLHSFGHPQPGAQGMPPSSVPPNVEPSISKPSSLDPKALLKPSSFNPTTTHKNVWTNSATSQVSSSMQHSDDNTHLASPATTGPETFTTPPSSPGEAKPLTHNTSLPGPQDTPTDEEMTTFFPNLNGDALALLKRLPEGDIPGVEYNVRDGSVKILLENKSEVDNAITMFQAAYKKVALSSDRRLRVECVDVPKGRTRQEVEAEIAKFEQQYKFCAFVLVKEKRQVKVISQARQFEQAKTFFLEALQQSGAVGQSASPANVMVLTLPSRRKLTLKKSNIVEEETEAIVNAANGRLIHGGGVAGALNAASQGQLQNYCDQYMKTRKIWDEIPAGEVAVTHGGGRLKCKHVIHAVGPDKYTHSDKESKRLIKIAVENALKAAEQRNLTSIAIPALSCGIFGISKELVAQVITDAILGFHFTKPLPTLSDIRIVIIDEPTHSCFASYFSQKAHSFQQSAKDTAKGGSKGSGGKGKDGKGEKGAKEGATNTTKASGGKGGKGQGSGWKEENGGQGSEMMEDGPKEGAEGAAAYIAKSKGTTGSTGQGKNDLSAEEDMPLGIEDLAWLMNKMSTVTLKWKEIMLELIKSNKEVHTILDSAAGPYSKLNKGITEWLHQTSPKPTLRALDTALRSKAVKEAGVASDIMKAGRKRLKQRLKESSADISVVSYPQLPPEESMDTGNGAAHPQKTNGHTGKSTGAGPGGKQGTKSHEQEECSICLEPFNNPVKTKCGHTFCNDCIHKALQFDPYCPNCKKPLRAITGKQPVGGTMNVQSLRYSVPGYEGSNTIEISYAIPSGVQGPEHPNPGQRYQGTTRVAYLPDTDEGREVYELLQRAFNARLVFTVGTSVTTGAENQVVWNDIHHKTNMRGGQQSYGYPDPTYLQRVKEDLAVKGIVPHSSTV